MHPNLDTDPYLNLRNGIAQQAAEDFREGFSNPEDRVCGKMTGRCLREDAKRFFLDQWGEQLLSPFKGEEILARLTKETLESLKQRKEHEPMKVTLIQAPVTPVDLIAQIASVCYDSRPTNKKALVKHLYLNGHHSVFEHLHYTFHIEGISRACSHQLVRHRMATITQRSQRYCEENGFDYVTPEAIKKTEALAEKYNEHMSDVNGRYCDMIHLNDINREDARYVLPNACVTELYFSCNFRELIHIANERLCSRAQWEIRAVVQKMTALVDRELRWMLVPKCESGFMVCNTPCPGKKGFIIPERQREAPKKGG